MKRLKNIFTVVLLFLAIILMIPLLAVLLANVGIIWVIFQGFQQWYTYAYSS